jgi:hypothetical protein
MSGIFTRASYDECYFKERNKTNENNFYHTMNLHSYVNDNLNKTKKVCPHNIQTYMHCGMCKANKEAKLLQTPNHFAKRTDIESTLFGIGRPFALCSTGKFGACGSYDQMKIKDHHSKLTEIEQLHNSYKDPAYHALERTKRCTICQFTKGHHQKCPHHPAHPHYGHNLVKMQNDHRIMVAPTFSNLAPNKINYTLPYYLKHQNEPHNHNLPFDCSNEIALNPWLCERDIVPTNMMF